MIYLFSMNSYKVNFGDIVRDSVKIVATTEHILLFFILSEL